MVSSGLAEYLDSTSYDTPLVYFTARDLMVDIMNARITTLVSWIIISLILIFGVYLFVITFAQA